MKKCRKAEYKKYNDKRRAELDEEELYRINEKRKERYSDVIHYTRTRLSCCILNSVLTAIRGVRGKSMKENLVPVSEISFNLLDNDQSNDLLICVLKSYNPKKLKSYNPKNLKSYSPINI